MTIERLATAGETAGRPLRPARRFTTLCPQSVREEVGELPSSLPFWGLVTWQVRPLQSARSTVERKRRVVERIRAATGGDAS